MNRRVGVSLAGICLLVAACSGDTVSPKVEGPAYAVSDGAHNGNTAFFFLPPMFKMPTVHPGTFNPSLAPEVAICDLGVHVDAPSSTRDCVSGAPLVADFPPGTVAVSLTDELYQVNWRTDLSQLNANHDYRIRVLVGGALLGFADVDPVSSGSELKNVQTNEYIGLVDGRTLPIKFRIENAALCDAGVTACSAGTINLAQGGEVELHFSTTNFTEDFKLDIPSGTGATFGGQAVNTVTFNLAACPQDIAVDLPLVTVGRCVRVTTYFNATGTGELDFSKNLLISMCALDADIHTPNETAQEKLITLHQQDGTLIRALPHAIPDCSTGTIGTSGPGEWMRALARLFTPTPALAASRTVVTTLLHVGGGGSTGLLGGTCTTTGSATVPQGLHMTTSCPPSSAPAPSGPAASPMASVTPPHTTSDFQFALPAKMDYVNPDDAQRTAEPGASLPTAVKVTDWDGNAVQGAHVTFIQPAIEGPGLVLGTATSNSDGVAQFMWTISGSSNTVVATGRGIAAQNNYPNAVVKPFMPDISLPPDQEQPVALGTGRITFVATGGAPDLLVQRVSQDPASPTIGQAITVTAVVANTGSASAGPVQVNICIMQFTELGSSGVCSSQQTNTLGAGTDTTLTENFNGLAAGVYNTYASVDTFNVVAESNENNNSTVGAAFTVDVPPDQQNLLDGQIGGQGIGRFSDIDGTPDPNGTSYDFQDAQTFTVGATGQLTRIKVPLVNNGGATDGVTMEIVAVVGGVPDETHSLGEVTIPASAISTDAASMFNPGAWATFDLTSLGISVAQDQQFAFILRSLSTKAYLYDPEFTSGYASGSGFRRNRALTTAWGAIGDFGFQTFVVSN